MNQHNDTARIITFYSQHHLKHAPQIEFLHGQNVPFFEQPVRAENLLQALQASNLITFHEPEKAIDPSIIKQAHDDGMVDYLQRLCANLDTVIRGAFSIYHMEDEVRGDNYFYESIFPPQPSDNYYIYDSVSPVGAGTWQAALYSATVAVNGADAILNGVKRAFSLCRPPGHHAGRRSMGGYCYFNNAAIAAYELKAMGKVAILDIDYHHGNGTQDIFWNDPEVLFISLHADPKQDYPYYVGNAHEIGGEGASGTNLNLPLAHGSSPEQYFDALQTAYQKIREFGASTLIVSLGFDTYKDDPIAQFQLDIPHYETIGAQIAALGLPTLYVQEGGYAFDALGRMVVSFFNGVLDGR